jgi:organic radical activating enzyme
MMIAKQKLYHVTVLSNFVRGFDKYSHSYSKAGVPESTFPDRFFLLQRSDLEIGIRKASQLLDKLGFPRDRLIVLETDVDRSLLHANTATGRGDYINSNRIDLAGIHEIEYNSDKIVLRRTTVEDAMAASFSVRGRPFGAFVDLRPRTISFLPIAFACQAKCSFCFSKASISSDQAPAKLDWGKIAAWIDKAATRGAERAVITGGGEPTLLPADELRRLVSACASRFTKIVLVTNAHVLATAGESDRIKHLSILYEAGLRVLAISRHHDNVSKNELLMTLRTPVDDLTRTWREHRHRWPELRLRFICVLQKGGVENERAVEDYLTWATNQAVDEICFKELYVSTSTESLYFDRSANDWSRRHQVPLSLITRFAEQRAFAEESTLPWGAPVYQGQ